MLEVFYILDQDKYYIKGQNGPYLARQTAATKLMSLLNISDIQALQLLDEAKDLTAVSSSDLKQEREKAGRIDMDAVYADLAEQLPVCFAVTPTADKLVFFVNDKNEVTKLTYRTKEDLVNAFQTDNKVWRALKEFYSKDERIAQVRHKLSFREFLMRIATDFLVLDENKQIDPEAIKRISWDQDDYAFKKFDVGAVQPGDTPTWDEFTSRIDYPEIFMAWVWSILEPENNVRQLLWLTGHGDDGKSVVQKALTGLLGKSYVKSMQAKELGEKFFLSSVYGKVLVNYADCDDIYLLNNPKIKQITGGDSTSIEFKSKDSFTGDVYAKLFVTSNKNPKINPESRAQVTRLIRLDVQRPKKQDSGFQSRLEAELFPFLHKCREHYTTFINEGNNRLNLPEDLQDKIFSLCASESYNIMRDFFHNRVEFGPQFYCPVSRFKLKSREYAAEQHIEQSQIKFFMADVDEKLHLQEIRPSRIEVDGQMTTVYVGFRIKGDEQCVLPS